jgi:hypothetical protein
MLFAVVMRKQRDFAGPLRKLNFFKWFVARDAITCPSAKVSDARTSRFLSAGFLCDSMLTKEAKQKKFCTAIGTRINDQRLRHGVTARTRDQRAALRTRSV